MGTIVNLDPDIEALLLTEVRNSNLEFDRVVNEALRVGLSHLQVKADIGLYRRHTR